MKAFPLALLLLSAFCGCSPTAKLLKERRYSEIITGATAKLNVYPTDKKAQQSLRQAYSEALVYYQSELNRIRGGSDSLKWTKTFGVMQETNDLADEIRYNTAAFRVVCDLNYYTTEIQEAKKKAIGELFASAQRCMKENTKEKAKEAYFLLKKVAMLAPDYPEISAKISDARMAATYKALIDPVHIQFNTLAVSTKKIDKAFFYWTQRDVSSRPFIRFYTPDDADRQNIVPDYYIRVDVLDYRVEKMSSALVSSGSSNLMAFGNLSLKIFSADELELLFKKSIACRYDSQTKSTIRVNTIDLQRVIDPDIQTFFDYMLLSNFERITDEIENYFSTLVKR